MTIATLNGTVRDTWSGDRIRRKPHSLSELVEEFSFKSEAFTAKAISESTGWHSNTIKRILQSKKPIGKKKVQNRYK